jgi:hypothetical protein
MTKRLILQITLGQLRGLKELGYLSKKGLAELKRMEDDEEEKQDDTL